jgi:hypothetical protein
MNAEAVVSSRGKTAAENAGNHRYMKSVRN